MRGVTRRKERSMASSSIHADKPIELSFLSAVGQGLSIVIFSRLDNL